MSDIERAARLKGNEDWQWAKGQLETIIQVYESIGTLDYKLSDTALARELRRRKGVTALIRSWLDEIESTGEMPLPEEAESLILKRFD